MEQDLIPVRPLSHSSSVISTPISLAHASLIWREGVAEEKRLTRANIHCFEVGGFIIMSSKICCLGYESKAERVSLIKFLI